jgi:hypothetical protein
VISQAEISFMEPRKKELTCYGTFAAPANQTR